jgi:hypothetical protein
MPWHEIQRRVMLAERNWAVAENADRGLRIADCEREKMNDGITKGEGMETTTNESTTNESTNVGMPGVKLDIPGLIRMRISKLNGAPFTTDAIQENCPEASKKRLSAFLSQMVTKGYLERVPETRPAQYHQVWSWSLPAVGSKRGKGDTKKRRGGEVLSRSTQARALACAPEPAKAAPERRQAPVRFSGEMIEKLVIARDFYARRAQLLTELLQFSGE